MLVVEQSHSIAAVAPVPQNMSSSTSAQQQQPVPLTDEQKVHVTGKFNKTLRAFVDDLAGTVPDANLLQDLRAALDTLFKTDAADRTILNMFMDALNGGAAGFIQQQNSTGLVSVAGTLLPKQALVKIYKSLGEDDKKACWAYITKLSKLGAMVQPSTGPTTCDMLATTAQSMIGGLDVNDDETPLAEQAFQKRASDLIELVRTECSFKDGTLDESIAALCTKGEAVATMSAEQMYAELNRTDYADRKLVLDLFMKTEETVRQYGIPFFCDAAEARWVLKHAKDGSSIVQCAMQLAVLATVMTSLDPSIVATLERVIKQLSAEHDAGSLDVEALAQNPMAIMSMLASSGAGEEVMDMMKQLSVK